MDIWYTLDSPPVIPFHAVEEVYKQVQSAKGNVLDKDLSMALIWEHFCNLLYKTDAPTFVQHRNPDGNIEMMEDLLSHADLTMDSFLERLKNDWNAIQQEKELGIDTNELEKELRPVELISFYDRNRVNWRFGRNRNALGRSWEKPFPREMYS
jgi:hypothetical protein